MNVVVETEVRGEALTFLRRVTPADEHRVQVVPAHLVVQYRKCSDSAIDSVLRTHDSEVAGEVPLPALELRICRQRNESCEIRTVAYDVHALRRNATAGDGNSAIAL